MSGREDVAWLVHGRELREMWCCPLPKGLGTSQGPHGLVYTGKPHRNWLGKVLKSCKATILTNNFQLTVFRRERSDVRKYVCVSQAMVKWGVNMVVFSCYFMVPETLADKKVPLRTCVI